MFALSGLTDSYAATQYKTKTFYIYGLSDTSNVQIKAIRDSDGHVVWGWGSTGAGGNINVYNLGGGTWQVTMSRANVTNWTPYCYVTTSKWGYDPTGWTLGEAGPHGTAGYNGSEVHHEGDFYFSNNSCSFYIGAGFCRNSLTANWTPWQHNVSYNTNGGKLNDDIENPNDYVLVDNGEYFLRSSVGSNMFMHASGYNNYGPNVVIWSSYSYSADQTVWIIERYKDTPYYYIYNKRSSKALNLQGDGAGVLDTLELYSVRSADDDATYGDFLWYFVDEGNGNVSIRNKKTNKVIDVDNGSSANGTTVKTYQYNGSVAQVWSLYQASQNDYPTKKKESGLDHYINSATPVREGYEFLYWCGENTTPQMTTIQDVNQSCIKRYRLAKVNGYDRWELLVYAENCSRIQAPMWTEKNGQDDLIWHELGSGSWERDGEYFNFGAQITVHNSEVSGYFLHLYARDGSGNTVDQFNTSNQIGKIGAIYRPGEHYTLDSKDSITLYAIWNPNNYTVHFDGNGASEGSMEDQAFVYDVEQELYSNEFSKDGYVFDGWNTESDGSGNSYSNGESVVNLSSKDGDIVVLYAQWTPIHFYIRFNGNGNTGGTMSDQMFTYGQPDTLNINRFTKSGYTFMGWNTEPDGNGYRYVDGQTIMNLSSTDGTTIDLYAQWSKNNYSVIFNGNGSTSGSMSNQKFEFDVAQQLNANAYKKTGYVFSSWNTKSDGTGTKYTDRQQVKNLVSVNGGSITLYAQWIPVSYSVKFNGNGNTSGSMSNQVFEYDKAQDLKTNAFSRTGYVFSGWNTKSDGTGTDYSNGQSVKNLSATNGAIVNLYAKWTPISYTVSFDGNGATSGSMIAQSFKYDELKALTANAFKKTGYTFTGWNTSKDGSGDPFTNGQVVSNLASTGNENVTLYAQWTPVSYTVAFNGNGNTSGSMASQVFKYDETKALTSNTFTKTGYQFTGWNTSKDGSGSTYGDREQIKNLTSTAGATVTLYAQWTPISYTVSFNGNGHTGGSMTSQSFRYDETKALSPNSFIKTGYTFTGWNTQANGNGTDYTNEQQVKNLTAVNGATITLYAQWETNTYTVNFIGNGATGGTMNSQVFAYNETKPLSTNTFVKTGYMFTSWNTKANGTGTKYTDKQQVSNLTSADGGAVNLYAQWTPVSYTVIFNGNGHTGGSMANQSFKYDESKALTANNFTKTGYLFNGWNTKKDGSGTKYTNGQTVSNLVSSNGGSVTLFAQWKPISYTVKFDGNGSTGGSMMNQSFEYDESKALTANAYKKTGYTFIGWNTSKDGSGKPYTNGQVVSNLTDVNNGTVTLYAQWSANDYIVKFDGNGSTSGAMSNQSFRYDEAQKLSANMYRKTGYIFTGWNTMKNGSGAAYADMQSVENLTSADGGTVTLYAQWTPISYTVVFNGNGSTNGTMSNQIFDYDESKPLTKNAFTRAGYKFSGWSTNKDGSGQTYSDAQVVSNLTAVDGGIVNLYAKWQPTTYTVVFDGNGNTGGSMSDITLKFDIEQSLPENSYVKKGYTFTGWNTKADGSGKKYSDGQSVTNLVSYDESSITLYAQWTANDYIVKFDGNGSTGGNMSDQSFKYDQKKALNPNEFIRTGYTFNGWNTKADGSGIKFADKETVMNLTDAANGVVTLYAQWTANSYTVVFDGNGSTSGSMNNQSFKYDEEKSLSKNQYSRTGYQFTGWNTKPDGTGKNYKDQDSVKNLTSVNNGTVTLYAQWKANSYTVIFDGNGNTSGNMENQVFRYDIEQKLLKNQFTKTGYIFTGWNVSKDGSGKSYKDQESVKNLTAVNNGTVILYAQWSEISYTVRYHGNDNTGGKMNDQVFRYTEEKKLLKNEFTNIGYRFTGWNTAKDGSGKSYTDQQTVSRLTDRQDGIVDLYAQWVLNVNAILTVEDEYYHVGDKVTADDIRDSLAAKLFDLTSGGDITSGFDKNITDKVITKQIVNEANEVQDISEKLDTSSNGYYYATYVLMITDRYNPDNQVAVQIEQKIVIVEDIKGSQQQVPQVVPDGSGVTADVQPIRYISKKYLNTLSENSKWKTDSALNQELTQSLNKEATDENAIYIIEMSKEDCKKIKEYVCDGKVWDRSLNSKLLDKFGSDIITKKP